MKWPIKIGEILPKVTRGLKIQAECKDLVTIWPEIVGDQIAKHASPTAIENKILYIHVDSAAWHHHLFMLKGEVLRTIGKRLPGIDIREIRMITRNG